MKFILPLTLVLFALLNGCASQQLSRWPTRTFEKCTTPDQCSLSVQSAIITNWSRPGSARNHMQVILLLSLKANGEVLSINIDKSSGDQAYDLSAIEAVKKASPFIELTGLSEDDFNKYFKDVALLFDPIDLKE